MPVLSRLIGLLPSPANGHMYPIPFIFILPISGVWGKYANANAPKPYCRTLASTLLMGNPGNFAVANFGNARNTGFGKR